MNFSQIEKEWKTRGFSFGVWKDLPGTEWEDYVHTVDELFMVVEGDVELEMDGKILHPKPGEEILIPAQMKHSVRNRGKTDSCWLYGYQK